MSPDEINSAALWGILGLAVIAALVFFANSAIDGSAPALVAGQTMPTVGNDGLVSTDPGVQTLPDSSLVAESTTTSLPATTTSIPATTTRSATTTTSPSTTASATTSTTVLASTTTSAVPATTTTTGKPTTTVPPTTTTLPPPTTSTTTTTRPPATTTTTTVPPTTTTTTVPPPTTTTTTIPLPGLLIHKFDGHDHGDVGAWEAHIKIEIRDENDNQIPFPLVTVAWNGTNPGSAVLATDKDGKVDIRLGLFSDSSITLRITDVRLGGYAYRPALNLVSSTLVVVGPN